MARRLAVPMVFVAGAPVRGPSRRSFYAPLPGPLLGEAATVAAKGERLPISVRRLLRVGAPASSRLVSSRFLPNPVEPKQTGGHHRVGSQPVVEFQTVAGPYKNAWRVDVFRFCPPSLLERRRPRV